MAESMEISFWEKNVYAQPYDLVIIGAGFVGLNAAIEYQRLHPEHNIALLDRGVNTFGASTKNAGFACFGSPSEILSDLKTNSRERVIDLLRKRWEGLSFIKQNFTPEEIDYEASGSVEVFSETESSLMDEVRIQVNNINMIVQEATGLKDVFKELSVEGHHDLGLQNIKAAIVNKHEGVLNPAKLHRILLKQCRRIGIDVILGMDVDQVIRRKAEWEIKTKKYSILSTRVCYTTNAYTHQFFPNIELNKVKNQVYLSQPIEGLVTPLCAHGHQGYIYFRNVGNRLLIGGARFLDNNQESDDENLAIKSFLQEYAQTHITGCKDLKFVDKWIGHIAVGNNKEVLMSEVEDNCWIAVRLGGMGVAIGHQIGKDIANMMA